MSAGMLEWWSVQTRTLMIAFFALASAVCLSASGQQAFTIPGDPTNKPRPQAAPPAPPAPAPALAATPAEPAPLPGNTERWRVVIYADRGEPGAGADDAAKFWDRAYGNLKDFLRQQKFNVEIVSDDVDLDAPLTDMTAQLGLLSDHKTSGVSRTSQFYTWQFEMVSAPFSGIDFELPDSAEHFHVGPENARLAAKPDSVHAQSIQYAWNVTAPEAPMIATKVKELRASIKLANAAAAPIERSIMVVRTPSARLRQLVRVRIFDITIADETTRTRFLDIFRQQTGATAGSKALIGNSRQPPVLFVPYSRIPWPVVIEQTTLTFGTSETVSRLWAAQVLEFHDGLKDPTQYSLLDGGEWKICKTIGEDEFVRVKRKPRGPDEVYFWQVTLDMKIDPTDPQKNSPVMFVGRSADGKSSAWVYDRAKGVRPVDSPEWLGRFSANLSCIGSAIDDDPPENAARRFLIS